MTRPDPTVATEEAPDPDAVKARGLPEWNFTHLSDNVLPRLRELGVEEADIQRMLVDNPRRSIVVVEPQPALTASTSA